MNQLIPKENLPATPYQNEEHWGDIVSSSQFLPRIQLFGSSSDAVKEGKINQGQFGLVRSQDQIDELGNEVDCLPLSWRYKAMRFGEETMSIFNPENPEFTKIKQESTAQDSGCLCGIEFLIWLAENKEYVTYYMSNKSSLREAPVLKGLIGSPATLKVKLVSTKKYKWHAPLITVCSVPFNAPNLDEMTKQAETFANQADSDIETVEDQGESRAR